MILSYFPVLSDSITFFSGLLEFEKRFWGKAWMNRRKEMK